jgi:hypothetical protein
LSSSHTNSTSSGPYHDREDVDDELEHLYLDLEWLRDEVNAVIAQIDVILPPRRRIELLENVEGRKPAEAEAFEANAAHLRHRLDGDR